MDDSVEGERVGQDTAARTPKIPVVEPGSDSNGNDSGPEGLEDASGDPLVFGDVAMATRSVSFATIEELDGSGRP